MDLGSTWDHSEGSRKETGMGGTRGNGFFGHLAMYMQPIGRARP